MLHWTATYCLKCKYTNNSLNDQMFYDYFGGMAIAEVGGGFGRFVDEFGCRLQNQVAVGIGQEGGTVVNEFHPLGFGSQHHAALTAEVGLFLQTTAVGQDES